ncbi:hypothetical protein ACFPK1_31305 [Actinomycetospora rhizophila]|uniref:Major facilitator superfamily (MFS) profile domain-containing protein n=1 Tax=Actinomycetospora rhizophila TaxID=1416876 RepID=A0ABV9ZNR1_9PSEU
MTTLSIGRLGGIVGPLYGGLLLTAGLPTPVLFYAFAGPALLGALVILAIRRPAVPEPAAGAGTGATTERASA